MKKNKFLYKIPYVIVLISILLGVFSVVAFADSNTIGEESFDIGNVTVYDCAEMDHGLPFSVTFNGLADSRVNTVSGFKSIAYTLDKFGVTYPPSNENSGLYLSDQYAKIYSLAKPGGYPPYSSTTSGYLYSYYDYLDVEVDRWYDDNLYYEYGAYLVSPNLAPWTYSYAGDLPEAVSAALEDLNGDSLIFDSSCVSSSVKYSFDGTLYSSLLTEYSYAPTYMTNYCLMPLDAAQRGIAFYYDVRVEGYSINVDGLKVSKINHYSSTDSYNTLGSCFSYYEIDYASDYSSVGVHMLADYFDHGYGLVTYACFLDFTEFANTIIDQEYVVTDIDIVFGLESPNSSNGKIIEFKDTYGSYPIIGASVSYDGVLPYTYDKHITEVDSYLRRGYGRQPSVTDIKLNWLGNTLSGVLDVDLFGTFGLSDILYVILGIGLIIMFIKLFAGG